MSKYGKLWTLGKKEQEELFIKLARAMGSLDSPIEAAEFLKDLLSEHECLMLARRLQIAEMLEAGMSYEEIRRETKAGFGLTAKIQAWLRLSGDGYRKALSRTKSIERKEVKANNRPEWGTLKKQYPMYKWPELLLTEIVKSASKRQRDRIQKVLFELKEKSKVSEDLEEILRESMKK